MLTENKLKFMSGCLKHIVCTKNRNEDIEEYQKGVLEPYNEIKEMYYGMVKENSEPSIDQMGRVLNNVLITFKTKNVPENEQIERIEAILKDSCTRDTMDDCWKNFKKLFYS